MFCTAVEGILKESTSVATVGVGTSDGIWGGVGWLALLTGVNCSLIGEVAAAGGEGVTARVALFWRRHVSRC